jgi:mono/diheme cytochrome c family protein
MLNVIALVMLIAGAALFVWLSIRAQRIKASSLKWGGVCLAGVVAAVASVLSVIMITGLYKLHSRSAPVPNLKVVGTPEQIQRGQAIANSFCGACHSKTGNLTGGVDIGNDLVVPIGSFIPPNLTPAGQLKNWSDGEIFRAIRNGVDADGHWMIIMSYSNAGKLSDDDMRALIAYIRTLAGEGQQTPNAPDRLNPLGIAMLGAGLLPTGNPVFTGVVTAPLKAATVKYGEYILSYQDCRVCHGANLTGGVEGQLGPIGPDLNLVKAWKLDEFVATMRTGVDPNGHELSKQMPWRPVGNMDDVELGAIYQYLTHMPNSQSPATK